MKPKHSRDPYLSECGTFWWVPLQRPDLRAKVCHEGVHLVAGISWCRTSEGYASTSIRKAGNRTIKNVQMHRYLICQMKEYRGKSYLCDHINRDRLDNRIENLRWVTPSGNAYNKNHRFVNRFRNVSFREGKKRYYISMAIWGRQRFFGSFRCEKAAAVFRDAVVKLYDTGAILNFSGNNPVGDCEGCVNCGAQATQPKRSDT